MSSEIMWDHESISTATDAARNGLESSRITNVSGGGDGVSAVVGSAVTDGNTKTNEEIEGAQRDADGTKKASKDLSETDEEGAKKQKGIDTELSGNHGKDGGSGGLGSDGPKGLGKGPMDAGVPTAAQPGGAPQQPQMPQMPPVGSGGGMPSWPQMTQADVNNAPNRDALMSANRGADGGSGGSLGKFTDDPEGRRAQELADKLVNHQPPIPYAWGGGHGGAPGPSQGIHDGGYADQCGDYRKRGVDCSGLARWMTHTLYGVDINGTSQSQYASGHPVSASNARPGDLFFPHSSGRPPTHVQVYVGNNMVIEAQKSGTNLKFSPLQSGEFRRFVS
ncbi:MAG: peptidoglycan endopeptidase [Spirochaetes bacterium]|nr:MAG: peptidoglycan endopeptidase [Spirochaetota bacterium]